MIGYRSTNDFQCAINSSEEYLTPDFGSRYIPFWSLFHSLAATSIAIRKSFSGSYPASLTASRIHSIASSSLCKLGANPPSSPTEVAKPFRFNKAANAWNTSALQRSASRNESAPTGMIINSCTSTVLAACAPPFKMFIIGTGSFVPDTPPTKR